MKRIVRVKNISYTRYEELIRQRDELQKEAFCWEREYTREFGDLILKGFEKKIDCIRLRKTIEFCQAVKNRGGVVDQKQLQEYLIKEMAEFTRQMESMIKDAENAKKSKKVTQKDLLEIKRIYHRIAKQIHPDMNPKVREIPELMDLWNRVSVAYKCNQLKALRELEVLVGKLMGENGEFAAGVDIPDLNAKIAELEEEIEEIRSTDPYQYQFLLQDSQLVQEKKDALEAEYREYALYEKQLEEMLQVVMGQGVMITW